MAKFLKWFKRLFNPERYIIEVYRDQETLYRWRFIKLIHGVSAGIAKSEQGFNSAGGCGRSIETIKRYLTERDPYLCTHCYLTDYSEAYAWKFSAANNEVLAIGDHGYESAGDRDAMISQFIKNFEKADIRKEYLADDH